MGDDEWWYVNDKGEIYRNEITKDDAGLGKLWLKKELNLSTLGLKGHNEDMRYYYEDESALGLYDYGKIRTAQYPQEESRIRAGQNQH